jgi:acyl-CoA reductase-like NAD-dependent aldehyde dehydrogenase
MSETQSSRKGKHLAIAGTTALRKPRRELVPISPIDLKPLSPVQVSTAEEVAKAVASSRLVQSSWRLQPLDQRISALKRAAREMLGRRSEVIDLARSELGKVEVEGLFNEALGPVETVTGWAGVVGRATKTRSVRLNPVSFPKKHAEVEYVPRGVVGIIAPWNFPVAGIYRSVFPALMTGNGVVLKPSEYTPRTSAWFIEKLAEFLPEGLAQVVQGDGEVGAALIEAGIDSCVFTGSPRTGGEVRVQCARKGIPASVEMGGKDAAIVLADCDLDRTVAGITQWKLNNVGQACGAIEIAYVDGRSADAFVERLRKSWAELRAAPAEFADIGPLGNRRQLDVVIAQVEDARAKGATVVCGGAPSGNGLWYPPTILDHCTDEMSVVQDETFGPVLAVVRITGVEEAIHRVNEARYGLGTSIWTTDLVRARRLASRLDVGVVTVNSHGLTGAMPALPWSGTRATGFGIANGPESLGTFVRPRTVLLDGLSAPEPYWMPYDRSLWKMGDILADAQLAKVSQAWRLPLLWRERLKTIRRFFS